MGNKKAVAIPTSTIGEKKAQRHDQLKKLQVVEQKLKQLREAKDVLDKLNALNKKIIKNAEQDAFKWVKTQVDYEIQNAHSIMGGHGYKDKLEFYDPLMQLVKKAEVEKAYQKRVLKEQEEELLKYDAKIRELDKDITQDIRDICNKLEDMSISESKLEKMSLGAKMSFVEEALKKIEGLEQEEDDLNTDLVILSDKDYEEKDKKISTLSDDEMKAIYKGLKELKKKQKKRSNGNSSDSLKEEIDTLRAKLGDPVIQKRVKNTNHKYRDECMDYYQELFNSSAKLTEVEADIITLVSNSSKKINPCKTKLFEALTGLFAAQSAYLRKCEQIGSIVKQMKSKQDKYLDSLNAEIEKVNANTKKINDRNKAIKEALLAGALGGASALAPGVGKFATVGQKFAEGFIQGAATKSGEIVIGKAIESNQGMINEIKSKEGFLSQFDTVGDLAKGDKYGTYASAAEEIKKCLGAIGAIEQTLIDIQLKKMYETVHPTKLKDIIQDMENAASEAKNFVASLKVIELSKSENVIKKAVEKILWAEFFAGKPANPMNHSGDDFAVKHRGVPSENAIIAKYKPIIDFLFRLYLDFEINPDFGRFSASKFPESWGMLRHDYKKVWPAYIGWGTSYDVAGFWKNLFG